MHEKSISAEIQLEPQHPRGAYRLRTKARGDYSVVVKGRTQPDQAGKCFFKFNNKNFLIFGCFQTKISSLVYVTRQIMCGTLAFSVKINFLFTFPLRFNGAAP
jgi:hypothetical protein